MARYFTTAFPNNCITYQLDCTGHVGKAVRRGASTSHIGLGFAWGDPNYGDCSFDDWFTTILTVVPLANSRN